MRRLALCVWLAAYACFPGPLEVDTMVADTDDADSVDDIVKCPQGARFSGNVVTLGSGWVHPLHLTVDRSGRAIVAGSVSGSAELGHVQESRSVTVAPEVDGVFWAVVPPQSDLATAVVVGQGAFGGLFMGSSFVSSFGAADSLTLGLVFVVDEGSVQLEGDDASIVLEPGVTPAIIVQGLFSTGALGSHSEHHGHGASLKPIALAGRGEAVLTGMMVAGARASLARAHGGTDEMVDGTWIEGDPDITVVAGLANGLNHLGSVAEPLFLVPGLFALALEPIGDTNAVSMLAFVLERVTLPTPRGPVTLEPSDSVYWFELSSTGFLMRHAALLENAAGLTTPLATRQRWLPTLRRRVDGSLLFVSPLRDGMRLGPVGDAAPIQADAEGLLIASYDASLNLEWTRRIQWISGEHEPFPSPVSIMLSDAIVTDGGAIVLGGAMTGELSVDADTTVQLTKSGSDRDGWLVAYDREGELTFALNAVRGPGAALVTGLAMGLEGELVVTGAFEGPTEFGAEGSVGRIDDVPGYGAFLMRLDASALACEDGPELTR